MLIIWKKIKKKNENEMHMKSETVLVTVKTQKNIEAHVKDLHINTFTTEPPNNKNTALASSRDSDESLYDKGKSFQTITPYGVSTITPRNATLV